MKLNEKQRNLIKIGLYIGGLILIIVIVRLSTYFTEQNYNRVEENNQKLFEKIKNINDDYYSSKVQLILDDDAISLDYEKILTLETGTKMYHGKSTEYIKKDNIYYTFDNGNFNKLVDFVDFDYDKTFINLSNIKRLLDIDSSSKTYKNDDYYVIKLEYELEDVLPIYNEFNGTNIVKIDDIKITIDVYYKEEKIEFLLINTTDFYNLINDTLLENVIYKISFEPEKEQDISWILDKLN